MVLERAPRPEYNVADRLLNSVFDNGNTRRPLANEASLQEGTTIIKPIATIARTEFLGACTSSLEYLSRTRQIETDTERTAILQGIVDRMLTEPSGERQKDISGHEVHGRVVILNKGRRQEAFVLPDGTICISQSLLNALTLDEAGAVVGHELGHLINETSFNAKQAAMDENDFGVRWLHEAASDTWTPDLLVRANLNSLALGSAIQKISAGSRGDIHGSGEMRGAEIVGFHGAIHTDTSSKEHTPLDQSLIRVDIQPTNAELIKDLIDMLDAPAVTQAIPLLHPKDLRIAHRIAINREISKTNYELTSQQADVIDAFHAYFANKLRQEGYNVTQINLFLLLLQNEGWGLNASPNYARIRTPEDVLAMIQLAPEFYDTHAMDTMETIFFEGSSYDDTGIIPDIFKAIRLHMYNPLYEEHPTRIPLTQDVLLDCITTANEFPFMYWSKYSTSSKLDQHEKNRSIAELVQEYIATTKAEFFTQKEIRVNKRYSYTVDVLRDDAVRTFLERIKNTGIPLTANELNGAVALGSLVLRENDTSVRLTELILEIFKDDQNITELIANFVGEHNEEATADKKDRMFGDFLSQLREEFDNRNLSDEQRLVYIEQVGRSLDELAVDNSVDINKEYNLGIPPDRFTPELQKRLLLFKMRAALSRALFINDGDSFYQYERQNMQTSGIQMEIFSQVGRIKFFKELLGLGLSDVNLYRYGKYWGGFSLPVKHLYVRDFDRYCELPFVQQLQNVNQFPNFQSFYELNQYLRMLKSERIKPKLYDDSIFSLVTMGGIRENIHQLFQQEISEDAYEQIFAFVKEYYPSGPQRQEFVRSLHMRILHSSLSLERKIDYLVTNFDDIGLEGMVQLAEQITTLSDYTEKFYPPMQARIQEYLHGSNLLTTLAMGESLSSFIVQTGASGIVATAVNDPKTKKRASTDAAKGWFKTYFGMHPPVAQYDEDTGRVIVIDGIRKGFKSFGDLVTSLQQLSPSQRFATAFKLLLDKGGSLTSPDNRQELGRDLTQALGMHSSFVNSAIQLLCERAPADYFGFSLAQILGPLLFRSLAVESVSIRDVRYAAHNIPASQIPTVLRASTRDLISNRYSINSPNSMAARLARQQDDQLLATTKQLELLLTQTKQETNRTTRGIDPNTDALIRGVEASGPMGPKSLQIARQLLDFSGPVDRRLADAFDARPGLPKLAFWENLRRQVIETTDDGLRTFIQQGIVDVGDVLGGGSLFTTFRATIRRSDGSTTKGIVKMLAPNAVVMIETTYKITREVLTEIEAHGSPEDQRLARMALVFVDLSHQWTLREINDPTYEQDDDLFRVTAIERINQRLGKDVFYAPERLYNGYMLKSETEASARTVNQFLNDPHVPLERKSEAIRLLNEFLDAQLETQSTLDQQGNPYFVVHSDPHVGNHMISINDDGQMKIGIIDRHMYLRLTPPEAHMFRRLSTNGNYREFIDPFISDILAHNNIEEQQARGLEHRIFASLRREYFAQQFKRVASLRGTVDNFALMRRLMQDCADANLEIPLHLRLMIRNVEAGRKIRKRFKVA